MRAKQDYSYSMDKESHLINVQDAIKGNDYYCPCCGEALIPRQGNIRRWHFAHKGNLGDCSYETYLHKVAKKRICECFNESSQFTIVFPRSTCDTAKCQLGMNQPCTMAPTNYDLKKRYNLCKEEVTIDKYRADLVISHQTNNVSPILIEIYVKHKSTEEKLNSNYRIIEIHIESEEDINQIVSDASFKKSDKIRFYNFKDISGEVPECFLC